MVLKSLDIFKNRIDSPGYIPVVIEESAEQ